ncbi:exonuclease domain-containing protein [Bacteroides uniformis]|uniref:3'-5' exonuclease n=1 Tax=Bacteroides uniformis TaxID=820 RepID=UPI00233E917C|nr:exonuclease domain-containing protein [Bacteroides uniformis]MDC1812103.1 exonuclease domain-containing protein [Bacteroides uniformis]
MAAPKNEPKIYVGVALDFETGGLDCVKHACTQIAMQAVRFDTWEVFNQYVCYISPYKKQDLGGVPKRKILRSKYELAQNDSTPLMEYEDVALTYSGITMEMLYKMGADYKKIASDIIEFGRQATLSKGMQTKPLLLGQNILFDIGFLQQLMNYADLTKEFEKTYAGHKDFYGNFQPHYVDTIDLARFTFAHDPSVTSYKLELIAEHLGIELDDAHDAAADVTATINVASVCSAKLRNNEGGTVAMTKKEKTRSHFKI